MTEGLTAEGLQSDYVSSYSGFIITVPKGVNEQLEQVARVRTGWNTDSVGPEGRIVRR